METYTLKNPCQHWYVESGVEGARQGSSFYFHHNEWDNEVVNSNGIAKSKMVKKKASAFHSAPSWQQRTRKKY